MGELEEGGSAALATAVLDEEARRQVTTAVDGNGVDQGLDGAAYRALTEGADGRSVGLRAATVEYGASTLVVLTLLNVVDELDRAAVTVLAPDIQRSLGVSDTVLAAIAGASGALLVLGAVPLGILADRTRRTRLVGAATLAWAAVVVVTGLVRNAFQLFIARMATGLGQSNVVPVHSALLADTYPPGARGRVFAVHAAGRPLGQMAGPLIVGGIAAAAGREHGWRWAFALVAVPATLLGLVAWRLREPRRGAHEQLARGGQLIKAAGPELPLSTSATFQRLKRIRTFHYTLLGVATVGFALFSVPLLVSLYLENRYGYSAWDRGALLAFVQAGPLVVALFVGRLIDRLSRHSLRPLLLFAGACIAAFGTVSVAALYLPGAPALGVGLAVAQAAAFAAFASLPPVTAAVVPYRLRSQGFAFVGVYLFLFGAFGGLLVTGALSDAFGQRTALTVAVPPAALLGGALVALGARHADRDVALALRDVDEEHAEARRLAASPEDVPVLQVRNLDVSYGSVQVLYELDLEVGRGETVALLGTNGAGKSTLLRCIGGLVVPDRGVVRLNGRTVTLTEAELRSRLGMVQVRGGEAVFPALTVREHLDLYLREASAGGRSEAEERVFETFPVLGSRQEAPARDLSGGQQQMLALSRALVRDPELLLIDELSLGLAPVTVQELLEVVEALKERGVPLLMVEQSLNLALAVADRAVFLERGRVRFTGPAAELADRDDLLRAVFLGEEGG